MPAELQATEPAAGTCWVLVPELSFDLKHEQEIPHMLMTLQYFLNAVLPRDVKTRKCIDYLNYRVCLKDCKNGEG